MNKRKNDFSSRETIKTIKKTLKSLKIRVSEKATLHDKKYTTRLKIKGFYHMGVTEEGKTILLSRESAYQELIKLLSSRNLINTNFLGKEKSIISFQDEILSPNITFSKSFISTFFEKDPKTFMEDAIKYRIASPFKTINQKEEYLPIKLINETSNTKGLCTGNTEEEAISKGIQEILGEKESNIDNLFKILKKKKLKCYIKDYSYLDYPVYKVFIPTLSNERKITEEEKDFLMNYELMRDIYFDIQKEYPKVVIEELMNSIKKILKNDYYSTMNLGTFFHSHSYLKTNYNHISFELFYVLLNYKINESFQEYNLIQEEHLKEFVKGLDQKEIRDKTTYILKELECVIPSCPNCNTCECRRICKYKNWNKINEALKKREMN